MLAPEWNELSASDLAQLVADTHVEQQLVLKSALDNALISRAEYDTYVACDCAEDLRLVSEHALTTQEFLERRGIQNPRWLPENRKVKVGGHVLRLPVGYVARVIDALAAGHVSFGKAAEMLFLDEYAFAERFPEIAAKHRT